MSDTSAIPASPAADRPARAIDILLALSLVAGAAALIVAGLRPVTEAHGFRQAQTAISAYWMLRGAPWLDYWTPVLGPPWSAPFEFPLYQWLLAAGSALSGWSIDTVGRLLSYGWLLASLPPAAALARRWQLPPLSFRIYAALLLISPQFLMWGRAVMIETQALALALLFLWAGERAVATGRWWVAGAAAAIGVAAGLTKITTLGPFLAVMGFLVALTAWRVPTWTIRLRVLALGAAMALPALLAVAAWNHHADALKAANPIADALRSNAPRLIWWNFGTAAQRVSVDMAIANLRALLQCFGVAGPVLLVIVGWRFAKAGPSRSVVAAVSALVGLYMLPWFVLTNLHIVHSYYQTANAPFLIAAAAVALAWVATGSERWLAVGVCVALWGSALVSYVLHDNDWRQDPIAAREATLAQVAAARTPVDSVLLTYGLDWSPVVPYMAGRVARMEPDWTLPADFRTRLPALVPSRIDGRPVGALIRCPSLVDDDPVSAARLDAVVRAWRTMAVAGCTVSFPPAPPR